MTREGSWFDAARRNVDLIELARKIDSERRPATPEEQAQLAKYVGFGVAMRCCLPSAPTLSTACGAPTRTSARPC